VKPNKPKQGMTYTDKARNKQLVKRYGITVREYGRMLALQDGVCALCHHPPKKKRLSVDHNHKTGKVRGLLCYRCNKYRVSNHTTESVRRLLEYFLKYDA
jgi:hypothetical protein